MKPVNMLISMVMAASAAITAGAYSARAQGDPNPFYAPQTPSNSTDMGLTNPAGSAIYVPKQPPHLLAGAPPPTPTNPTSTNNVVVYPRSSTAASNPADNSASHQK